MPLLEPGASCLLTQVVYAASHPARLQVLSILMWRPCTGGELAAATEMSWGKIYQHLIVLRSYRLLQSKSRWNRVLHTLSAGPAVEALDGGVRAMLAEVQFWAQHYAPDGKDWPEHECEYWMNQALARYLAAPSQFLVDTAAVTVSCD